MISCEKDPRVSFYTSNTCITRQFFIKEQGPMETPGMIRPNNGKIIDCSMCVGCETGLKFFKERGECILKTCVVCRKELPANKEHFKAAPKSKDGLSWRCIECFNIQKKQESEAKMDQKMKRCSRKTCLKIHPATAEFFGVNKQNKDGLSYYCRACQAEMAKESYAKKNNQESINKPEPKDANLPAAEKTIKKPEPAAKEKPEQICTDCGKSLPATTEYFHSDGNGKLRGDCKECRSKNRKGDSRIITLDLKDEPELVEKISIWAKINRRIPAQQIIHHLEEILFKQFPEKTKGKPA